ncbi:hypothetical protein D1007_16385 [Hordeum vulgare]|nr:hypothetical protein D1007_16385 [Hordeum vulgare]
MTRTFNFCSHNGKDNLSGQQDVEAAEEDDPKELKRQRNREYYAHNKEDILKRRREAREKKHASTTVVNDKQNVAHTPLAMTLDVDPNELQRQMAGEQYSQNMDFVFNRQHEAYGDGRLSMVITNLNDQENETQTPVSMSIDPKELRRQRDRERYAQNRDEILKRQRLSREKRKTASRLLCHTHQLQAKPVSPNYKGWHLMLQRQQRHGSSKIAIGVPLGQKIQPTRSIIRDIAQGPVTQNSGVHVPQLSILHGKDSTIEDAGIQPSNGSNQPVTRPANDTRRHAEPASHGTQNTNNL